MLKSDKYMNKIGEINKVKLLNFLTTILLTGIIFVIPYNYYVGKFVLATIELSVSLSLFILNLFFKKKNDTSGQTWILTIFLLIFSMLPTFSNTHYTAYSITIGSMIIIFIVQGFKKGFILNLSVFILSIPGYFYRISKIDEFIPVSVHINFVFVYIILFIISIFNESIKFNYQSVILKQIEDLRKLSVVDSLTNLNNRRSLDIKLKEEWARHKRFSNPLSILMCDIDNFKLYNDALGHQEGDKCLIKVANILIDSIERDTDFISRYGGEEFLIILPNATRETAKNVAEKIIKNLSENKIPHPNLNYEYVSLSIGGCSTIPTELNSIESLISLADNGLYQSKKNGRNRFTYNEKLDT